MEWKDIEKAVKAMATVDIKGKQYAMVTEKVKAFKSICPNGAIITDCIKDDGNTCMFVAEIYIIGDECISRMDAINAIMACGGTPEQITALTNLPSKSPTWKLSSGHAKEEKQASFINKTSYIENCETSAVGRALSFAGFGGDASIASAEEVANAIQNQTKGKIDQLSANGIFAKAKKDGVDIEKICQRYGVKKLEELTAKEGEYIINNWSKEVIPNCKA